MGCILFIPRFGVCRRMLTQCIVVHFSFFLFYFQDWPRYLFIGLIFPFSLSGAVVRIDNPSVILAVHIHLFLFSFISICWNFVWSSVIPVTLVLLHWFWEQGTLENPRLRNGIQKWHLHNIHSGLFCAFGKFEVRDKVNLRAWDVNLRVNWYFGMSPCASHAGDTV